MTGIRPEHHDHDGYPPDWDARRWHVYHRDGYTCQRCGARGGGAGGDAVLHAHHVTHKSDGGSHHPENLQTLCADCHDRVHGRVAGSEEATTSDEGGRLATSRDEGGRPATTDADGRRPWVARALPGSRTVAAVGLALVGVAVGIHAVAPGALPIPDMVPTPGWLPVSEVSAALSGVVNALAATVGPWYGTTPVASVVPAGRATVVASAVAVVALVVVLFGLGSSR